jgi:hypothetical protein
MSNRRSSASRPRSELHPYQEAGVAFFLAAAERQLVAPMGAGKTIIALTAIVDLHANTGLTLPVLIIAPLMIAAMVWDTEAAAWQHTLSTRSPCDRYRQAAPRRPRYQGRHLCLQLRQQRLADGGNHPAGPKIWSAAD